MKNFTKTISKTMLSVFALVLVGSITSCQKQIIEKIIEPIRPIIKPIRPIIEPEPLPAGVVIQGDVTISNRADLEQHENTIRITGRLSIIGSQLRILDGLNRLEQVEHIFIEGNTLLNTLSGFSNLERSGNIRIRNNNALTSITGFENFERAESDGRVGRAISIDNNNSLRSVNAFANLTSVARLWIRGNDALTSITGFENIESIYELAISSNSILASIPRFNALIGATHIHISSTALTSLDAFRNINKVSRLIHFRDNPYLTSITGFANLAQPPTRVILSNNGVGLVVPATLQR